MRLILQEPMYFCYCANSTFSKLAAKKFLGRIYLLIRLSDYLQIDREKSLTIAKMWSFILEKIVKKIVKC